MWTTDGGGNVKPANQRVQFYDELYRRALDLDEIIHLAQAPGNSKRHPVERINSAVNAAVGTRPINSVYENEINPQTGKQDSESRQRNMSKAVDEVVQRVSGTMWSGEPLVALGTNATNCILSSDSIARINTFLDSGSAAARHRNDFRVFLSGSTHDILCELFDGFRATTQPGFLLSDVYNHINSDNVRKFGQKFISVRPGESPLVICPIPDVLRDKGDGKIKYRSYEDTKELYAFTTPGYYEPLLNLQRNYKDRPAMFSDDDFVRPTPQCGRQYYTCPTDK